MAAIDVKVDFHHPYTPYDIQETFMTTVYQTIEAGNIGILESPTGTARDLFLCHIFKLSHVAHGESDANLRYRASL